MVQSYLLIPSEVWSYIFAHLSVSDKLSVRTCCKFFKKLVDHWSLWKGWTVALSFRPGTYNGHFWTTLSRRRVSSALVRCSKAMHWKQLSQALPALSTLVLESNSPTNFNVLKDLAQVKRVAVKGSVLVFDANSVRYCQQLTHLCLCGITLPNSSKEAFLSALSSFTQLTSMVFHPSEPIGSPLTTLKSFTGILPVLKHLSLSCKYGFYQPGSAVSACKKNTVLTSLELVNYEHGALPGDTTKLFTSLRRLSVVYNCSNTGKYEDEIPSPGSHLSTWLSDLPQLSNLVITRGPAVSCYVSSIPATLTSLTVCGAGMTTVDMKAVAARVPDLSHLHLDPWPSHSGPLIAEIPQLFPKLNQLKVRLKHVPEKDFLSLHKLQNMECLEILDGHPDLLLVDKLRAISLSRLKLPLLVQKICFPVLVFESLEINASKNLILMPKGLVRLSRMKSFLTVLSAALN